MCTPADRRLMSYAGLMVYKTQSTPPPPPGFADFADELELFVAFRRITVYNYMVFGEFYHKVLSGGGGAATDDTSTTTATTPALEAMAE